MNAETVVNNGESYMKQYINKEITFNEVMDKIYNDMNNAIYDSIVEGLQKEGIEIN